MPAVDSALGAAEARLAEAEAELAAWQGEAEDAARAHSEQRRKWVARLEAQQAALAEREEALRAAEAALEARSCGGGVGVGGLGSGPVTPEPALRGGVAARFAVGGGAIGGSSGGGSGGSACGSPGGSEWGASRSASLGTMSSAGSALSGPVPVALAQQEAGGKGAHVRC